MVFSNKEKDDELAELYEHRKKHVMFNHDIEPRKANLHFYLKGKGFIEFGRISGDKLESKITPLGMAFYVDGGFTGEAKRERRKRIVELAKWSIGTIIALLALLVAYLKL